MRALELVVSLLYLLLPFVEPLTPTCTNGFTLVNNRCLMFFPVPLNHESASEICTSFSSSLVTAKNAIDNRAISSLVVSGADSIWMGLYCVGDSSNSCYWVDNSGTAQSYSNFASGYPSLANGRQCVYYQVNGAYAGQWFSGDCATLQISFVCEAPTTYSDSCTHNYDGNCYFPSFELSTETASFIDAVQICAQLCGELAFVNSVSENKFITNIFETQSYQEDLWIGGAPFNDEFIQPARNCLARQMSTNYNPSGYVHLADCLSIKPYLCKRPAGIPCSYSNSPTSTVPSCTATIVNGGSFASPNYPYDFNNNYTCSYTLISTLSNRIWLQFDDMFYTDYVYDPVLIYDGSTTASPLIANLTGPTTSTFHYVSSSNQMLVVFTPDRSNVYRGFKAHFVTIY